MKGKSGARGGPAGVVSSLVSSGGAALALALSLALSLALGLREVVLDPGEVALFGDQPGDRGDGIRHLES